MSKEIQDMGEKVVTKKPWKDRNSPMIGTNGLNLEEGDNAKFLGVNIALFNMSKIDMHDPVAVQERLTEFFRLYAENDMKPTVAGMAMALGMNRRTLWAIVNDQPTGSSGYLTALPPEVALVIKKAHFLLENLWESYMNSGKINPVSGIFLGKNNFGYQDKQEMVLTPNTQNESDFSEDDLRKRYMIEDGENNA